MRRKLLFAVFPHVVQEDVAENEMRHTLGLELLHGTGHRFCIILHIAFGRQVGYTERNADAFGLRL